MVPHNAAPCAGKPRLLFVDDEPHVLHGLRRMLHAMRHTWDLRFAPSGPEALALCAQTPVDVLIADMRMPGMDGVQLLAAVREHWPQTIRLILSGQAERARIVDSVPLVHQYLSKPCDAAQVKTTLARLCALRPLLPQATLQPLVTRLQCLPSLPYFYAQVRQAVDTPGTSLEQVSRIMAYDPGMTAKVFQLVHATSFGARPQVSTLQEAIEHLGWETLTALVRSEGVFSPCDPAQLQALSLTTLWPHSLATGRYARHLARQARCDQHVIHSAYLAGLLHDVGKLVFAATMPDRYQATWTLRRAQGMTEWEAERTVLGATHAEVGAYLLGLWGLPEPLVDAVALHHRPAAGIPEPSLLAAVQRAHAFVQELPLDALALPLAADGRARGGRRGRREAGGQGREPPARGNNDVSMVFSDN